MRRPVLLCGVGVGPLPTRTGRVLAALIVRSASFVSVRDHGSFTTCRDLGLRDDRLARIPDVVFVNERRRFVDAGSVHAPDPDRLRIALNLNRDIANGARWEPFLRELAEALDLVAARTPIEIHALPMQPGFKTDDDLSVLREFLADRPNWHPVVHEPGDHRAVAEIIVGCDVVVSERLHAIVISAVIGRPVVGLIYDVKVAELVEQLGIADRSVDVNAAFEPERLAVAIEDTVAAGPTEAARLTELAGALRAGLDTHFDDVRRWLRDPGTRTWNTTHS